MAIIAPPRVKTKDTPVDSGDTMEDVFGNVPSVEVQDPTASSIYDSYKTDAMSRIDPAQVRKDITNQFSDRLSTLGSIYDRQLEKVTKRQQETNDAELGRQRALEARGIGGYSNIVKANRRGNEALLDATQTVADAKTMALDPIYGQIDSLTANEVANKQNAKAAGGANYLSYIKDQGNRKSTYASQLAESLVNDPSFADKVFTDADFDALARRGSSLGLTRADVATAYRQAKQSADAAAAKAALEGQFNLSEGGARYAADGTLIASRAKTYAPDSGSGSSGFKLTQGQKSKLLAANFNSDEADQIAEDVAAFGVDSVVEDMTEAEAAAVRRTFSGSEGFEDVGQSGEQFLNSDYFAKLFGEDGLKQAAKDAGFRGIFSPWASERQKYLESIMNTVEQYRAANYTDQEILEMMQ